MRASFTTTVSHLYSDLPCPVEYSRRHLSCASAIPLNDNTTDTMPVMIIDIAVLICKEVRSFASFLCVQHADIPTSYLTKSCSPLSATLRKCHISGVLLQFLSFTAVLSLTFAREKYTGVGAFCALSGPALETVGLSVPFISRRLQMAIERRQSISMALRCPLRLFQKAGSLKSPRWFLSVAT